MKVVLFGEMQLYSGSLCNRVEAESRQQARSGAWLKRRRTSLCTCRGERADENLDRNRILIDEHRLCQRANLQGGRRAHVPCVRTRFSNSLRVELTNYFLSTYSNTRMEARP